MSDRFTKQARELQEFADIRYTEALAIVRADRWPDPCVASTKCLVAEWLRIRNIKRAGTCDDRVCNCEECKGTRLTGVPRCARVSGCTLDHGHNGMCQR